MVAESPNLLYSITPDLVDDLLKHFTHDSQLRMNSTWKDLVRTNSTEKYFFEFVAFMGPERDLAERLAGLGIDGGNFKDPQSESKPTTSHGDVNTLPEIENPLPYAANAGIHLEAVRLGEPHFGKLEDQGYMVNLSDTRASIAP